MKQAFRLISRMKGYTALSLLGLVISLSGTVIIARYLHQEWTIDHWMPDLDRICFALREEYESDDPNEGRGAMTVMKMPKDGQPITEMEGVEAATSVWLRSLFSVKLGGEKTFTVCTISADSDFVKVFPLKAVECTLDLDAGQEDVPRPKRRRTDIHGGKSSAHRDGYLPRTFHEVQPAL